jgi:hypothetical protein
MDKVKIIEQVKLIDSKRESLVKLLTQTNLGNLRLDVTQALEELDELIDEFKLTFPEVESDKL